MATHIIPHRLLHRTQFQRFMWCNGISRRHCYKCDGYFMDFPLLSNSNEIIVCARVKVISCFRSIKFLMTNKQVVMSSHAYTIHSHSFDSMKSWSIKYSVMDCIDFFYDLFCRLKEYVSLVAGVSNNPDRQPKKNHKMLVLPSSPSSGCTTNANLIFVS